MGRASRAFPRPLLPALDSFTNTWHSAGVEDKPQPLEISRSWEIMSLLPMELQGPFTKVPQIPRAFNEHETSLWCPTFFLHAPFPPQSPAADGQVCPDVPNPSNHSHRWLTHPISTLGAQPLAQQFHSLWRCRFFFSA